MDLPSSRDQRPSCHPLRVECPPLFPSPQTGYVLLLSLLTIKIDSGLSECQLQRRKRDHLSIAQREGRGKGKKETVALRPTERRGRLRTYRHSLLLLSSSKHPFFLLSLVCTHTADHESPSLPLSPVFIAKHDVAERESERELGYGRGSSLQRWKQMEREREGIEGDLGSGKRELWCPLQINNPA